MEDWLVVEEGVLWLGEGCTSALEVSAAAVEVEVVAVRVCVDLRDSVEATDCCCEDDSIGMRLEDVKEVDVAPTAAELAVGLPDDEGRSCDPTSVALLASTLEEVAARAAEGD